MRVRLLAFASLSLAVAGCGTGTLQAAGGHSSSSATTSVSPAAGAASPASASTARPGPGRSGQGATGTGGTGTACAGPQAASVGAGNLTGMEFASAAQGWAVGQHTILATSDGGAHWTAQLSGNLNLTSVDFINGRDGWAVGTTSLLATTDGGAHWTPLPEPCQTIRSVHFISPATGFAVAGGRGTSSLDPAVPALGGVVLSTVDGGRTWHAMTAPGNAQTVCFNDGRHGWLGASGLLYRTSDGGRNWTVLTSEAARAGSGQQADMSVECADGGSVWALRVGPGAAMSQDPHVAYHADQAGAAPVFAEQYFQTPGTAPATQSPGSYAGPFSAIDSAAAVFVDWCPACGLGTAPWDLASNSGTAVSKMGNVGSITEPQAASFRSPLIGWVAGRDTVLPAAGNAAPRSQERIVATADGGRTWHVEWSGPWAS